MRLARRRAQAAADLLKVEAEGLCRAQQDHGGHRRHVQAFRDQVAGTQHLHRAVAEAGDGSVALGGRGCTRCGDGAIAGGTERFGHRLGVCDRWREQDGRLPGGVLGVMADGIADDRRLRHRIGQRAGLIVAAAGADAGQVRRFGGSEDAGRGEEALPDQVGDRGPDDDLVEDASDRDAKTFAVEAFRRGGNAEDAGRRIGRHHVPPLARDGMVRLVHHDEVGRRVARIRQAAAQRLNGRDLHEIARGGVAGRDDAVRHGRVIELVRRLPDEFLPVAEHECPPPLRSGSGDDRREANRLAAARGDHKQGCAHSSPKGISHTLDGICLIRAKRDHAALRLGLRLLACSFAVAHRQFAGS